MDRFQGLKAMGHPPTPKSFQQIPELELNHMGGPPLSFGFVGE